MSRLSEKIASFCEKHPVLQKSVWIAENLIKKPIFKCQDCGQCVLSYNAFTCCMRCPKQMRNGPCGGTRDDGHCEVYPERLCIWWLIYQRAKKLRRVDKLRKYHIPVDRRFEHTSAWLNMFAGKIEPLSLGSKLKPGEEYPPKRKALQKSEE
ncbi:MAG: methylenetetrahydrofolate reductase C-terminal domain-containing protein [Armatimonadota bacterium]|nr:methylenetetrahydrofolate reductase C-terminal domain-containing protein [Armatimonadota bacterium]